MSAKGGKKRGAGRPKGAKDTKPRERKKNLPKPVVDAAKDLALSEEDTSAYKTISKFLSKENKKIFDQLMPDEKTPIESLKTLRDFLVARFKFYTIAEIEGAEEAKKIANLQLKELNEKGTVNGRKVNANYVERKKLELIKIINSKGRMNSSLNTLAAEIRQYNELIDRIESGRQDQTLNIFNILKGNADEETTSALTDELFKRTDKVDDVLDAEFTEEDSKTDKEEKDGDS